MTVVESEAKFCTCSLPSSPCKIKALTGKCVSQLFSVLDLRPILRHNLGGIEGRSAVWEIKSGSLQRIGLKAGSY